VLAGSRNAAQLAGNLHAAERRLSAAQLAQLNAATAEVLALLGPHADYFQGANDQRTE
jgi:aryl-alcohol dehydrogenase-like predicted oxidoreductase